VDGPVAVGVPFERCVAEDAAPEDDDWVLMPVTRDRDGFIAHRGPLSIR
jgi:hypothetical protein